ncbi:MAG TPA: glycosyltransferase 87 family protein [Candidatus Dormibacteraeota bacterium]|nr:glycosyltransferase 87 family protein [Candidatus Dormibacteraeota bacterium]
MKPPPRLPPLWLSASAMAAAITVGFGVQRWIDHFLTAPDAEDYRLHMVAARVGLQHGWSRIYDLDLMKAASAGLGPVGSLIDTNHVFMSPPPAAWMVVPIAWLPLQAGYLLWTLLSLALFVAAWWLVVPGTRLARVTVLLISLAVWPVHYQFWLGQWVVLTLALLALTWWLLERDRWVAAGVVLALALCFKTQDVLLVPLALLVSGRWRPVAVAAGVGAVVAGAALASLGPDGVRDWLNIASQIHADPYQAPMTYSSLFGRGALTTAVELVLGAAAIAFAWRRRESLDVVMALGIVGSTASAVYLHEDDMTILVLAAWLVLRSEPGLLQRAWLVAGIVAAQFLAIGLPVPMLLWEPVWIALLGLQPELKSRAVTPSALSAEKSG